MYERHTPYGARYDAVRFRHEMIGDGWSKGTTRTGMDEQDLDMNKQPQKVGLVTTSDMDGEARVEAAAGSTGTTMDRSDINLVPMLFAHGARRGC